MGRPSLIEELEGLAKEDCADCRSGKSLDYLDHEDWFVHYPDHSDFEYACPAQPIHAVIRRLKKRAAAAVAPPRPIG